MRHFPSPRLVPRLTSLAIACVLLAGSAALACTVPVFRFALERWAPDRFLVIVYYEGPLSADQNAALHQLAERSSGVGGPLNIEVIRYNVASPPPRKLFDLEPPPADQPLPWVEVRKRHDFAHTALRWRGPFSEAIDQPGLFDSPARSEIVRRILAGHSSVWLLIAPADQVQKLDDELQAKLDAVTKNLTLPKGIGLPGSELYTSIPLEIRCSVLTISHADAQEKQFLQMLAASAPEWKPDAAYVVPIFGRCRAMEVIPHWEIDEVAIEDIANFLCNACSCQVKQANPGFDLLASVNWDQRLYNGRSPEALHHDLLPGSAGFSSDLPNSPQYVTIPTGKLTEPPSLNSPGSAESHPTAFDRAITAANHDDSASAMTNMFLIAAAALLTGGILRVALLRKQ